MRAVESSGMLGTPLHARTLNNIACLRWTEGNRDAAISLYQQAFGILQRTRSSHSTDADKHSASSVMCNIGVHLLDKGEAGLAEAWLKGAMAQIEPIAERFPSDWTHTVLQLARVRLAQRKHEEACRVMEDAAAEWEARYGPGQRVVSDLLAELGALRSDMGDRSEGERHLRRALELRGHVGDPPDLNLAGIYAALGLSRLRSADFAEAERLFSRQLQIIRGLGVTCPIETAIAMNNVGVAQRELGRLSDSDATLTDALWIARSNLPATNDNARLGAAHLHLANVLKNLSQLRQRQGREPDALAPAEEAAAIAGGPAFATVDRCREILSYAEELRRAARRDLTGK
jgi:tetratricopeptide (TPR) repeat protein